MRVEAAQPERRSPSSSMFANMTPFGFGPRVCAGQNMAMMAIRMVLAAAARNFNIISPPETNEKSMDPLDSFVSESAVIIILIHVVFFSDVLRFCYCDI